MIVGAFFKLRLVRCSAVLTIVHKLLWAKLSISYSAG
jgi:hypothetical protein